MLDQVKPHRVQTLQLIKLKEEKKFCNTDTQTTETKIVCIVVKFYVENDAKNDATNDKNVVKTYVGNDAKIDAEMDATSDATKKARDVINDVKGTLK